MSLKSRTGEATLRLFPAHVADGFPAVLARSRMIELMELAAARLMRPHLGEAESSVSIEMQVTHVAAATAGSMLRAVVIERRLLDVARHGADKAGELLTA